MPDSAKIPRVLKTLTLLVLFLAAGLYPAFSGCSSGGGHGQAPPGRLIYIAIDSLHPAYLSLSADAQGPGQEGDWLMPNVRRFLSQATWYPKAKDYLIAATDMNHLNVLAGTSTAQTGIYSVSAQVMGWDAAGAVITKDTSLAWARDDRGRPVDTIFHAWKRAWPDSKTAFISGKGWVAEEMLGSPGLKIDTVVEGGKYPDYISAPVSDSFYDPPTDTDADCDPESDTQKNAVFPLMAHLPANFPPDRWTVDSALKVFARENPDLAYILLAECDDAGHALGAAWDPEEYVPAAQPYQPPAGCTANPDWNLVSKSNPAVYREPVLDYIRNVDSQFGRLYDGLQAGGYLTNTTVILLSDHAMNTLYRNPAWTKADPEAATDYYQMVLNAGLGDADNTTAYGALGFGALYWRNGKEHVAEAKALLEAHTAVNPRTGATECPWWVLDREDMKNGIAGVALPGELYHKWFVETDGEKTMIWPDLLLLSKGGWDLAGYGNGLNNLGLKIPLQSPKVIGPIYFMLGGHGSLDTQAIVAAISVPGKAAQVIERDIRIADLGVTALKRFGLQLKSTTIGTDLSADLK